MSLFTRKMKNIAENITVNDFEDIKKCINSYGIYGEKMVFPSDELN